MLFVVVIVTDPLALATVTDLVLGTEHQATADSKAEPSYCVLPIFHPLASPNAAPPGGYVSNDGHAFSCKNPTATQAFHVYAHLLHLTLLPDTFSE